MRACALSRCLPPALSAEASGAQGTPALRDPEPSVRLLGDSAGFLTLRGHAPPGEPGCECFWERGTWLGVLATGTLARACPCPFPVPLAAPSESPSPRNPTGRHTLLHRTHQGHAVPVALTWPACWGWSASRGTWVQAECVPGPPGPWPPQSCSPKCRQLPRVFRPQMLRVRTPTFCHKQNVFSG